MRISEIKACFTDKKAITIVSDDFWEIESYRIALCRDKGLISAERVFENIKDTFLSRLEDPAVPEKELHKERRYLRRLSFRLYGDKSYWVKGTIWEAQVAANRRERQLRAERIETIRFLYERLGLQEKKKKGKKIVDILQMIAKCDTFYKAILAREDTPKRIECLAELYNLLEAEALCLLAERKLSYMECRVMGCISYLAFRDINTFLTQNNLTLADISEYYAKLTEEETE